MVTIFFILNLCPSDIKKYGFHHVLTVRKFQSRTRCNMGGIRWIGSMHLENVQPTEILKEQFNIWIL